MSSIQPTRSVPVLVAAFLATYPGWAIAKPFVKFSGVVGQVADGRHTGWTEAVSWAPAPPPGQACTHEEGWMRCLARNGHQVTVLIRADQLSPATLAALKAGEAFSKVLIEDYQGDGTDFSASILALTNVRIVDVAAIGEGIQATDAVTVTFDGSSSQNEWSEPSTLSVSPLPAR
jgi:type VI protein secretion system component Hcp